MHIARSEFSTRLLREWPYEELVQWEVEEETLTASGLTNAGAKLCFSFDHYRPKGKGGTGVATHVALECAPGEAAELQKYLEAKVHQKLAGGGAAVAEAGATAAPTWKLGEGVAASGGGGGGGGVASAAGAEAP